MKRDLRFEAVYDHPIERVWRAITDSQAIAQWLMKNDFEPRVGHKFQLRAKPVGGWDGIVNGEVLECQPPRRLVYTWKSNVIDTRLSITLEPAGNGTRLVLEHTGFAGLKGIMTSFFLGSGWKGIVRKGIPAVLARMDAQGVVAPLAGAEQNRACQ